MVAGLKLVQMNHVGLATYDLEVVSLDDQLETISHVSNTATRLHLDFPTGTLLDIISESFQ